MTDDSGVLYRNLKEGVKKSIRMAEGIHRNGYSILRLVNREMKTAPDIPRATKLWAYRHGYVSASVPLYNLSSDNRDRYLSQWERELARRINGDFALVHDNKLLYYFVLHLRFPDALPELYGYLDGEQFRATPFSAVSFDSLLDCVDQMGEVIVKPVDGTLGDSVHSIRRTSEGYWIDEVESPPEQVVHLARQADDYIVTELVEQAEYAADIYPTTQNTIRIMTMVDPDTREPFIGALDHRFGTDESTPVDNTAQGGLSAGIDPETGRLKQTVDVSENGTPERHQRHPQTGARIESVEIPGWQTLCEEVIEMAAYLAPMTPYIGWDVLVTDDDGSFVTVEANSHPDVPLQVHEPLLDDERVRRFYEYHDVV